MPDFQIPTQIDAGYLCVPEFIADQLVKDWHLDAVEGIPEYLEETKYPFKELAVINSSNNPDVVKLMRACRIPFSFSYVYQEYMEVRYWQGLNAGCQDNLDGTEVTTTTGRLPQVDKAYLDDRITKLKAQLNILGGDVAMLIEVRNIHDADD